MTDTNQGRVVYVRDSVVDIYFEEQIVAKDQEAIEKSLKEFRITKSRTKRIQKYVEAFNET